MIVLKVISLVMLLFFVSYVLMDTLRNKRIKKLKELNQSLVELNKRHVDDYLSLYDNMVRANTMMRELKKENEELKKELDKQSNATYNYYIKCSIPNKDEATPPLTKK